MPWTGEELDAHLQAEFAKKPIAAEVERMCADVPLEVVEPASPRLAHVLQRMRRQRPNGDVVMVGVRIGQSAIFDWFARVIVTWSSISH